MIDKLIKIFLCLFHSKIKFSIYCKVVEKDKDFIKYYSDKFFDEEETDKDEVRNNKNFWIGLSSIGYAEYLE